MEFEVSPRKGIGPLTFGMTSDQVRRALPFPWRQVKRFPDALIPSDYFEFEGIFCNYDSEGELEAVELALPSRATLNGELLIGPPFQHVIAILTEADDQITVEGDGAIAYQLGISLYAPAALDDPEAPVESVLAFRPGYFN